MAVLARSVLALALVLASASAFVPPPSSPARSVPSTTVIVGGNPISRFFDGLDDFIDDAMDRKVGR